MCWDVPPEQKFIPQNARESFSRMKWQHQSRCLFLKSTEKCTHHWVTSGFTRWGKPEIAAGKWLWRVQGNCDEKHKFWGTGACAPSEVKLTPDPSLWEKLIPRSMQTWASPAWEQWGGQGELLEQTFPESQAQLQHLLLPPTSPACCSSWGPPATEQPRVCQEGRVMCSVAGGVFTRTSSNLLLSANLAFSRKRET